MNRESIDKTQAKVEYDSFQLFVGVMMGQKSLVIKWFVTKLRIMLYFSNVLYSWLMFPNVFSEQIALLRMVVDISQSIGL